VLCYSSLEHWGLGGYGDPVDPDAISLYAENQKSTEQYSRGTVLGRTEWEGLALVSNLHRIYGPIRFPMLVQGWRRVEMFGDSLKVIYKLKIQAVPPAPARCSGRAEVTV